MGKEGRIEGGREGRKGRLYTGKRLFNASKQIY